MNKENFESKYIPVTESGCWLWISATDKDGYGVIGVKGKQKRAHRLSYELYIGKIPDGLCIDHKCRVRCCVNPSHLEAVTNGENIRRGNTGKHSSSFQRNKTHCVRGHEFTKENTFLRNDKYRICIACGKIRALQKKKGPKP